MNTKLTKDQIMEGTAKCRKICSFMTDTFISNISNSKSVSDKDKETIINILNKEIYYIGGLWRSVFDNRRFNDVDVAFKNRRASNFIKHVSFKHPEHFTFTRVGNAYASGFKDDKLGIDGKHRLSFDFNLIEDNPHTLVGKFDFSMNRNFFVRQTGEELVDRSVFTKAAHVVKYPTNPVQAKNALMRMLRFASEGYDFNIDSVENLLRYFNSYGGTENFNSALMHSPSDGVLEGRTGIISNRLLEKRNNSGINSVHNSFDDRPTHSDEYMMYMRQREAELINQLVEVQPVPTTARRNRQLGGEAVPRPTEQVQVVTTPTGEVRFATIPAGWVGPNTFDNF